MLQTQVNLQIGQKAQHSDFGTGIVSTSEKLRRPYSGNATNWMTEGNKNMAESTLYLSSIFGLAKGTIIKKYDKTWTLHIALMPKRDRGKITGYLTQAGHTTRRAAKTSWERMSKDIEIALLTEQIRK